MNPKTSMTDPSNSINDQIQINHQYPTTLTCEVIPHNQPSSLQCLDEYDGGDHFLRVGTSSSSTQLTTYNSRNSNGISINNNYSINNNGSSNGSNSQNQNIRGQSMKRSTNKKQDTLIQTKATATPPTPLPLFRITNSFSKKPPLQAPNPLLKPPNVQTSKTSVNTTLNLSNNQHQIDDQLLQRPQATLSQRSPASNKQIRCLTPIILNRNSSISSKRETPTNSSISSISNNNQSNFEKSSKRISSQNLIVLNGPQKSSIDSNNLLKPSTKSNNVLRPQEDKPQPNTMQQQQQQLQQQQQKPESLLSALKKMNSGNSASEGQSPQHQSRRSAFIKKNSNNIQNTHILRRKQTTPVMLSDRYHSTPAQSEECYSLISSLNSTSLRCLFIKQKQSFNSNVLAINIEGLFFPSTTSFWEKELVSIFSAIPSGEHLNTIAPGPKESIVAKLRSDIRNFLKILSKRYTVILVLKPAQKSKELFHYLLRMNFPFDGAYQLIEQTDEQFSIDFNLVCSDFFGRSNQFISTFTYLDARAIPVSASERVHISNQNNQLGSQNKIPKIKLKDQSIISLVIIERKFNATTGALAPNYLTPDQIVQAIESATDRRESIEYESEAIKVRSREIQLEDSLIAAQQAAREIQSKNAFFEKISQLKQANHHLRRVKVEDDPDSRLEQSRNDLIDYMRSMRNSFNHLHYTVGDLLVRNREVFKTFFKDKFYIKPIHASNIAAIQSELKPKNSSAKKTIEQPETNQNQLTPSAISCIFAVIYSESRSSKENLVNPSNKSKQSIPID